MACQCKSSDKNVFGPFHMTAKLNYNQMKRIIALIFLAGFVSACSQYTCPTYAKKEAPKKEAAAEQKL